MELLTCLNFLVSSSVYLFQRLRLPTCSFFWSRLFFGERILPLFEQGGYVCLK